MTSCRKKLPLRDTTTYAPLVQRCGLGITFALAPIPSSESPPSRLPNRRHPVFRIAPFPSFESPPIPVVRIAPFPSFESSNRTLPVFGIAPVNALTPASSGTVIQAELAIAGVRPTPLAEGAQLFLTVDIMQVDDVDAARFGEVMVMLRVLHSSAVFMTPKHKGA